METIPSSTRRHDIDWLRVIAIGLLLLYHTAVAFQPWGIMLGFVASEKPWTSLWVPMTMLNVWRIPLLFFVSGMGVCFAIQKRNWKQLLGERARRILLPCMFGMFFIVPIGVFLWQYYYQWELDYVYSPGHLWFLGNIFAYVVLLAPIFFYLKKNDGGRLVGWIKKMLGSPLGLLPVIAVFVAESVLVAPTIYEMYAMTWHGFFLGLLAFFFGFCFVLSGDGFWKMLLKWRWLFLGVSIALYAYRFFQPQMQVPVFQLAIESNFWIFSIFAFGYKYLNRPSKILSYLSQAAYPVYIIHIIFQSLATMMIFPLDIAVPLKFILVLGFTFLGSFVFYEYIIRRVNFLRPLFGLKRKKQMSGELILEKQQFNP